MAVAGIGEGGGAGRGGGAVVGLVEGQDVAREVVEPVRRWLGTVRAGHLQITYIAALTKPVRPWLGTVRAGELVEGLDAAGEGWG